MGKPNTPVAWFKAVKKAFRSPSKEKGDNKAAAGNKATNNKDDTVKKICASEKCATVTTVSPTTAPPPLQELTPLPLPSFKKGSFGEEAEQEQEKKLCVAVAEAATDPPVIVDLNHEEEKEEEEEHTEELSLVAVDAEQEGIDRSNEEHCEEEEEEVWKEEHYRSPAAEGTITTIEQVFGGPEALKALVKLQALLRGHMVRRQAATTLRAIQALVRIQARVRGHQVRLSKEGQAVQDRLLQHRQLSSRPNKVSEGCWDASTGSVQDSVAKTQSREVGARKRERAMAYAFSKQLKHSAPNPTSLSVEFGSDQPHWGWSWLERWTATRPWENRHFNEPEYCQTVSPGKFSGDSRKEVESGSLTKAKEDVIQLPPVTFDQAEEDSQLESYTPEDPMSPDSANSPVRAPPSLPALDESTLVPPLSPLASEDSLHMPSATAIDAQLSSNFPGVISSAKELNGVAKHAKTNGPTSFESPDLSTPKDGYEQEQQERLGKMSLKQQAATGNRKSEIGLNDEKVGDGGEYAVPTSFKSTTSRYMTVTESAKAKFRSHSNPKSRNPEEMEMRIKPQRRLSQGAAQLGKSNSPSGTTVWSHQRTNACQANPKGRIWNNEKSEVDVGTNSPNRRESYGGGGAAAQPAIRWRN